MKRLVPLLFLLCALAAGAQLAKTIPAPTGYVDDYAHVLSPAASAQIDTLCHQVHAQTRAQIFLVTVPSLAGDFIEQFSNDLFHQWKIGEKGTDRGILIVFATGERMHRIEVGYGFEGILNDAKAGDIGRAITPDLHARRYDQAGLEAVTLLAAVIIPDVTPSPAPQPAADAPAVGFTPVTDRDHSDWGTLVLFVLVAALFFILWAFFLVRRSKRQGSSGTLYGSGVHGYSDPGSITTATLFSSGSDSSSSGFSSSDSSSDSTSSSDSSSDSSSSSDSFSGGDGGDSGGGGASGSDG